MCHLQSGPILKRTERKRDLKCHFNMKEKDMNFNYFSLSLARKRKSKQRTSLMQLQYTTRSPDTLWKASICHTWFQMDLITNISIIDTRIDSYCLNWCIYRNAINGSWNLISLWLVIFDSLAIKAIIIEGHF